MSKSSLRVLAVLLTLGIVLVLFANLDGLPRDVKAQIDAERKAYSSAQSQIESSRNELTRALASESALFAALPSAHEYPTRMARATSSLASAGQSITELEKLEKADRRSDRSRIESLIASEKQQRTA